MKKGDLIKIQHFHPKYDGKIGIVMRINKRVGFVDSYAIRVPSMTYEIGLAVEQCKVIT